MNMTQLSHTCVYCSVCDVIDGITGATLDALTLLKKKDITQQASFLSSSTISRCEITPCQNRKNCHTADEVLQFPFGTPLSEPLLKLKKLLEQNCTPEKVQYIFQLIEAGNLKDIDWDDAMRSTSIQDPPSDSITSHALECRIPACTGHPGCHAPDEVLQYPFGTPLPPKLVELKELIEQNESEEKIQNFFGQLETGKLKTLNCEIPKKEPIDLKPSDGSVSVSNPTSMSNCRPPSCNGHPECLGTTLPPDLVEVKKLIEQNESVEKLKQLFSQLQASNIRICETLLKQPNNHHLLEPTKIRYRPNQELSEYYSQNDFVKNSLGSHLSPYLVELKNLLEQNNDPKQVKHIMKHIENTNLDGWDWQGKTLTDDCLTSNLVPKNSISIVSSCHSPGEVLQYPKACLSPPMQSLKYLLERYYDPFKVQRLFKQLESGDYRNIDWVGALKSEPEYQYVPVKKPFPSVFCPQHFGPSGCHLPQDVLEHSCGTDLSTQLQALKKVLECYQDPKVRQLFEEMEAAGSTLQQTAPSKSDCTDPCCPALHGCNPYRTYLKKLTQLKSLIERRIRPQVQCNNFETLETYTDFLPDSNLTSDSVPTTLPYRSPTYQSRHGLPNQVLQHPFRTPLTQNLEELKIKQLLEEIETDNHENLDWECAIAILTALERDSFDDVDDTPSIPKPSVELGSISPCQSRSIGSAGKYIKEGSKTTPHNVDVGVGVEFRNASTEQYESDSLNKQIQKNSDAYHIQSAPRTKPIPRNTHRKNEVGQYKVTLMKPNITQTASRMKFDNNVFPKQHVKPSWTIDDLIRYYAKFNPEVLDTLISLTRIKKPVVKDMTFNEDSGYVYRQQPGENSQPPYWSQSQGVTTKETHELESRPFMGFKIAKHGKKSG